MHRVNERYIVRQSSSRKSNRRAKGVGTLLTNWTNGKGSESAEKKCRDMRGLDSPGTASTQIPSSAKKGHVIFDREINDLKLLDEALELGVVKERGKGLVAL